MDDALVHSVSISFYTYQNVLILVLMDDALVPYTEYVKQEDIIGS